MSAVVAGASTEGRPQTDGESAGQRIIKHERDNDIKDYAETTMNELLGWYGYDKLDTRGINLKNLGHHFPVTSSSSSSPTRPDDDVSEDDTGLSVSPTAENESALSNTSGGNTIICAWCLKMGLKLFTLKTASGETKEFCSEPCFNQCRRAAFKKNRVCNWCRHVRHTVNYVDFQDGDDQLQFCSDKCLNQYKMQIFCKETQAYLQMNPHLQEETNKNTASSKLITPDLWLRDCQESANGGMSPSGDELQSRHNDKEELEDLSVTSKSEHSNLPNQNFLQERELHKSVTTNIKDNLSERCNTLTSYLNEEKDKSDRRKRHHEMNRESSRKRQRIPSFRNKTSHHSEAPPAHLSSAPSSLTFQNQSSIFPPPSASFPLPLRSKSPVLVNPPAAHSKTFNPHPGITNPVLHPGLPPPPPLLNNDFYHPPYNPPVFPSHQHQLDAVLRMQAGYPPSAPFNPNFLPDSMLPFLRGSAQPSSIPQPNTVMLPFPIFVPLPVPIPIPLPLKCFLPKDKSAESTSKGSAENSKAVDNKDSEEVNSDANKNSKSITDDEIACVSNGKNLLTVQSSTDSDFDDYKLLKKTRKRTENKP